jgi:DNA-directed RNA polymerase specialized sigma24 family protein
MTVKEYLRQAYRLDHRIDSDISEMERLREMACSIGAPGFEEHYAPNHPTEAPFIRALEKVWKLEEKINAEIDRLVDLKAQMRGVIEAVSDPDERMVLRYRYIHNMTWEKIGDVLHADRTTVYRWHNTAIRHVVLPDDPIQI